MTLDKTALTTLSVVKDELGIASLNTDDDSTLERKIRQASRMFKRITGRQFHEESGHKEKVPAFNLKRLMVEDHTPIQSISKIELSLDGDLNEVDASNYEIENADAGFIRRVNGGWQNTQSFYREIEPSQIEEYQQLYTVTYTGGYVTPQQEADTGDTRDLPFDIEDAVIDLVVQKFRSKGRDPNVASEKIMSTSIKYTDNADTEGVFAGTTPLFSQVARSYMSARSRIA